MITDDAPTDNAQYYCQQAKEAAEQAAGSVGFDGTAESVSAADSHALGSETVQGQLDALSAPTFDDSGEVSDVTGFQAFLDKLASGMRFLDFFRDLKAGLKFVLHTGQLVNNGLCTEPGKFPLDAAFGKTLQDQLTTLNSNLDKRIVQGTAFTGISTPIVDNAMARLNLLPSGIAKLYQSVDGGNTFGEAGTLITNSDFIVKSLYNQSLEMFVNTENGTLTIKYNGISYDYSRK